MRTPTPALTPAATLPLTADRAQRLSALIFGVGLTLMPPVAFYAIGIAWAGTCTVVTWLRYARPKAPKPS